MGRARGMSRPGVVLTALLALASLAAAPSMAQEQESDKVASPAVVLRGNKVEVSEVPGRLKTGKLWIDAGEPECAKAHEVAMGPDRGNYRPQERLEALKTLDRCVDTLRVTGSGQLKGKGAEAMDFSLAHEKDVIAEQAKTDRAVQEFLGMRFGVGVGVSYSQDDIISDAEVGAGNVIVSTKDERTQPRVILESHYYGWCHSTACNVGSFGVGPFLGIVAKDEKLLSAFGAGVMLGWKDPKNGENDGWSIGVGAVLDANVKSLADGFEEGKPLPAGETEIRFEEKSRWSALLFFTRTF